MLGIKEAIEYDKRFPNPEGRARPCPRCKGGEGASDKAKKKRLTPIKGVLCFTCWGYARKSKPVIPKAKPPLTPKVRGMFKKIGRRATIRRVK